MKKMPLVALDPGHCATTMGIQGREIFIHSDSRNFISEECVLMSLYFMYVFCSHSRKSRDLPVASGNIPSRTIPPPPEFSHPDPWLLITQE